MENMYITEAEVSDESGMIKQCGSTNRFDSKSENRQFGNLAGFLRQLFIFAKSRL